MGKMLDGGQKTWGTKDLGWKIPRGQRTGGQKTGGIRPGVKSPGGKRPGAKDLEPCFPYGQSTFIQ